MKIGIAGSGNMAAAMARGWAAAGPGDAVPDQLLFTDAGSGRARELAAELGGEALAANSELAERADLILLAVKPGALDDVAAELAASDKPVLSLLGATPLTDLQRAFPRSQVARVMPNLGVQLRQGVLSLALPREADTAFREQVSGLLEPLGTLIEVDDRLMDAATAVMGCTPGYLALIAEILTDAGVREGLASDQAGTMVARSMAATGALLDHYEPAALREAVASPGGSTEAGLEALERGSLRDLIGEAVDASLQRMRG